MTVKEEEAVVQAFIKMWKDLTKTGDKLNASQMDAAQKMMKHATDMLSNTKTQKASITMSNKQLKFDEKELVVREKLKKADEHLVKLRHSLNIEQEREHGDQVRRNINLRKNMDSFNDKFDMLKKSLGGGFGFQAAMDKTVKDMGKMTRTFQENRIAGVKYKKAQEMSADALFKMQMAFQTGDDADKQEAKTELELAKKAELRNEINVENTQEDMEKSGIAGRFKPIFAKLDQIGGFLGKKAVPIGIGLGVAGVLMSVIVKAFSASPLFAQMMKMMKFMVTLILMPIGTFFGALLRPILVLLLRKFIVPMYSKFMPMALKVGGQVGKWITWVMGGKGIMTEAAEAIAVFTGTETDDTGGGGRFSGEIPPEGTFKTSPDEDFKNFLEETSLFFQDPLDYLGIVNPFDMPKAYPDTGEGEDGAFDMSGEDPMFNGKTPGDLVETEGERQVRLDKEERDRAALMESDQERTNRELAEAAEEKAVKEAEKHAETANWMELNRSVLDMNKLMETNGIITEAIPKVMTQEMTNFAAYGMEGKTEKGGDIHDAGIRQELLDERNTVRGNSNENLGSKGQSIMDAYNASRGIIPAADGFNGMVNSPTMFLAGESGSEHVSITPSGGSGGGITVNIQNMNGSDNDLRKLKRTILEVIQQSSANRGRL